jgi:signal transduction histidine kinase
MKTSAFLIRVLICFALSLIPFTELENRIYSQRMIARGLQPGGDHYLIVETSNIAEENLVRTAQPREIVPQVNSPANRWISDPGGMVRLARATPDAQPHLINFMGPAGTVARCQVRDCLRQDLKNKVVVIDRSEDSESSSRVHTPWGQMSRAELLANDHYTVRGPHPIYSAGWPERTGFALFLILGAAVAIIYYPVMLSAIAVAGTGLFLLLGVLQILFAWGSVYVPSIPVAAALLVTYLVFTGYRLAFQENMQWRNLKQAQYLREVDEMKTNFLSLVSHDLKTPIAKIQAIAERMRRELEMPSGDRSDLRELIESIETSNNELKHYVTSILNLSRIESQQILLNKKSNDLNRLIEQALKRLRPLAQHKQVVLEEKLEPLFSVECDGELIRQVLTNLLDNAIKFSPAHSRVIVRSLEEEGFVRVDIEDFGPGIPTNQLPLMFRKFNRFLRPIHEQVKGTGLGLYLSKYFIELHGGRIQVRSVEGQGTTFSFTLPLHGMESETILG